MSNRETQEDFNKFWKNISIESKNETLIILKGHLLLEDLMKEFCGSKVEQEDALHEAKLGFIQVMHLTKSLQTLQPQDWVWASIKKINRLRNQLAHNLHPEDYEKTRESLIYHVKSNSSNTDLFKLFPESYGKIAISIFFTYTALSSHLRFKPKGLLSLLSEPDNEHIN